MCFLTSSSRVSSYSSTSSVDALPLEGFSSSGMKSSKILKSSICFNIFFCLTASSSNFTACVPRSLEASTIALGWKLLNSGSNLLFHLSLVFFPVFPNLQPETRQAGRQLTQADSGWVNWSTVLHCSVRLICVEVVERVDSFDFMAKDSVADVLEEDVVGFLSSLNEVRVNELLEHWFFRSCFVDSASEDSELNVLEMLDNDVDCVLELVTEEIETGASIVLLSFLQRKCVLAEPVLHTGIVAV